jgi:phosphatidylinositol alpha-mannosyltransferase
MPMPLKIGIVSQAYHPAIGGVTEHVDATSRLLRERGHEVTVITARFRGACADEPGVVRLGRNYVIPYNGAENNITLGRGLDRAIRDTLRRGAFDVVHVHCPLSPTLPLLTVRAAAQPIVGTFHSTSSSDRDFRIFRRFLSPFFRRIDRPLAVSEAAREYVTRHFPGDVRILPNGVDLERFQPGLPRDPAFDGGVPNILFVGRHDPRKGLPDLLAACRILAHEGHRFQVIIVGDGWLRRRAERLASGPLKRRVHFVGRVTNANLPRYYASADVFSSPARGGESFGLVLLEAMACGVPVVASDLPGYRSVLTQGMEGLATAPRDPRALARALRMLLLNPELRARMGRRGIETARRHAWPAIVSRLEGIYAGLTGGGPAARDPHPPREEGADPDGEPRRGSDTVLSAGA